MDTFRCFQILWTPCVVGHHVFMDSLLCIYTLWKRCVAGHHVFMDILLFVHTFWTLCREGYDVPYAAFNSQSGDWFNYTGLYNVGCVLRRSYVFWGCTGIFFSKTFADITCVEYGLSAGALDFHLLFQYCRHLYVHLQCGLLLQFNCLCSVVFV